MAANNFSLTKRLNNINLLFFFILFSLKNLYKSEPKFKGIKELRKIDLKYMTVDSVKEITIEGLIIKYQR